MRRDSWRLIQKSSISPAPAPFHVSEPQTAPAVQDHSPNPSSLSQGVRSRGPEKAPSGRSERGRELVRFHFSPVSREAVHPLHLLPLHSLSSWLPSCIPRPLFLSSPVVALILQGATILHTPASCALCPHAPCSEGSNEKSLTDQMLPFCSQATTEATWSCSKASLTA